MKYPFSVLGVVVGLLGGIASSVNSAEAADLATVQEVVSRTVALYRGDGYLRYDHRIDLNFIEEDELNAYATWNPMGQISVNFFNKLLQSFTMDEVQLVVCHELGHLLGNLSHREIGSKSSPLSVEGEADYFAGKCLVYTFMELEGFDRNGAQEKAFLAALGAYSKLYETDAHARHAEGMRYDGINPSYPEPACRTLTVWNGAEDLPRPKCWYNP